MGVNEHFLSAFRVQLVADRALSADFKEDTLNYVVNQTALKIMGMDAASAIGQPQRMDIRGSRRAGFIGSPADRKFPCGEGGYSQSSDQPALGIAAVLKDGSAIFTLQMSVFTGFSVNYHFDAP